MPANEIAEMFLFCPTNLTTDLGAIGLATKEAIYPTHGPRR